MTSIGEPGALEEQIRLHRARRQETQIEVIRVRVGRLAAPEMKSETVRPHAGTRDVADRKRPDQPVADGLSIWSRSVSELSSRANSTSVRR